MKIDGFRAFQAFILVHIERHSISEAICMHS